MYQMVIILLVTAVVTIITTIVTVRLTMTGRIVSQDARSKFSTIARKYGFLFASLANVALNSVVLILFARDPRPIDRVDVILASFMVSFLVWSMVGVLYGAVYAHYRDRIIQAFST